MSVMTRLAGGFTDVDVALVSNCVMSRMHCWQHVWNNFSFDHSVDVTTISFIC